MGLALGSLCGARTRVSLCGVRTGFRECLLAFDSLWTGLVIVTSNVYSVCKLCYYRFNFRTISLIVRTPPLFRDKLYSIEFKRLKLTNYQTHYGMHCMLYYYMGHFTGKGTG